ncbi:hypothetical protein [Paenibacillus sp. NPDC055715]
MKPSGRAADDDIRPYSASTAAAGQMHTGKGKAHHVPFAKGEIYHRYRTILLQPYSLVIQMMVIIGGHHNQAKWSGKQNARIFNNGPELLQFQCRAGQFQSITERVNGDRSDIENEDTGSGNLGTLDIGIQCYLVSSGDPFMYCEEWLNRTACSDVGSLSSQRISDLLQTITDIEREVFFQAWCKLRCEQKYLALDITSTSSYSELIPDVEWGYNRDKEQLPQINMCMLMGETSRPPPIYQVLYSGSLKDVSTLETTLFKNGRDLRRQTGAHRDGQRGLQHMKRQCHAESPKSHPIHHRRSVHFTICEENGRQ